MADTLPVVYRKTNPFTLQFSSTETLQGVGYVTFYPCDMSSGSQVSTNILVQNSSIYASGGTTQASVNNKRFSLSVEKGGRLKGEARFNIPSVLRNDTGGQLAFSQHVIVNLIKTSSGVDSVLCSGGFLHSDNVAATSSVYKMLAFSMPITETTLAKGDTFSFAIWTIANLGGSGSTSVGHDPASRTDLYYGTDTWTNGSRCSVHVPFKIDI